MNPLHSAARSGDIDMLYSLLGANPRILNSAEDVMFEDTLLHIVASPGDKAGNDSSSKSKRAKFASEVAVLNPSLARKLNHNGLSPMHLALQSKEWTIVRALMRLDPELIRVKGRGGRTPLHVAAEVASPQLLAEMLYVCPSSIDDATNEWKSAVHIAVEAECYELFAVLLGWLAEVKRENILHWKDMDGNTVLHIAVRMNQTQVVKRLLRHVFDDVKNSKGETALAIHNNQEGPHSREEIGRLLRSQKLHACHPKRLFPNTQIPTCHVRLGKFLNRDGLRWIRLRDRFKTDSSYKQTVLVIAVLVVTITYQGIISLPGGVLQDISSSSSNSNSNSTSNGNNITTTTDVVMSSYLPGQMIMDGKYLVPYVLVNTLAFTLSFVVILACLPCSAFGFYLFLSMVLLFITYWNALGSIVP